MEKDIFEYNCVSLSPQLTASRVAKLENFYSGFDYFCPFPLATRHLGREFEDNKEGICTKLKVLEVERAPKALLCHAASAAIGCMMCIIVCLGEKRPCASHHWQEPVTLCIIDVTTRQISDSPGPDVGNMYFGSLCSVENCLGFSINKVFYIG